MSGCLLWWLVQAARHVLKRSGGQAYESLSVEDVLVAFQLLEAPPPEGYPLLPRLNARRRLSLQPPEGEQQQPQQQAPCPPPSLLVKHLEREVFVALRDKQTPTRHLTLDSLIQAGVDAPWGSPVGVLVGDEECYPTFSPLLSPLIQDLHGQQQGAQRLDTDASNIHWDSTPELDAAMVVWVQASAVRNLCGFAFPSAMSRAERRSVEAVLSSALQQALVQEHERGSYRPLQFQEFEPHPLLTRAQPFGYRPRAEMDGTLGWLGVVSEWPEARGAFLAQSGGLVALVNQEDHLHVAVGEAGTDLR